MNRKSIWIVVVAVLCLVQIAIVYAADGPSPALPKSKAQHKAATGNPCPHWNPSYPCESEGGQDNYPGEIINGDWWVVGPAGVEVWGLADGAFGDAGFLARVEDDPEDEWPAPGSRLMKLNPDGTYTEYVNVGTAEAPSPKVCGSGNNSF